MHTWFCTQTHTAHTRSYIESFSNLNLKKTAKIGLKNLQSFSSCCLDVCVRVHACESVVDVCLMHYMTDFHVWHSFSVLNLLFLAFRDTLCLFVCVRNSPSMFNVNTTKFLEKHFKKDETLQNPFGLSVSARTLTHNALPCRCADKISFYVCWFNS